MSTATNKEKVNEAIKTLKPISTPRSIIDIEEFLNSVVATNPLSYYGFKTPSISIEPNVKGWNLVYLNWVSETAMYAIESCILRDYISILKYSKASRAGHIAYSWSGKNCLCISVFHDPQIPAQTGQNKENLKTSKP